MVPKETKTKLKWPLAIFDYFSHLKTPVSNCKTGMKFPNFIYITFKWKIYVTCDWCRIFYTWSNHLSKLNFNMNIFFSNKVHTITAMCTTNIKYFLRHTQSWGSQPHQFMISSYKSRSEISNIWSATKGTDWLFFMFIRKQPYHHDIMISL